MVNLLSKAFGFDPKKHKVRTEILAGITTFLTMAYVLAVNPDVLSGTGMDKGALFTTTIIASVIATLLMSLYAKLPFALAPAMGLNAFFAYTVCLGMGYSWQFALTAVFIEGVLFILLTVLGIRKKLVQALPEVIRHAIAPGIGLFIAFLGLKNAGVVASHPATFVTLGKITDPSVMLAFIGLFITAALLARKVSGALLIGILVTTLIGIPLGVTHWQGFLSTPPSIEPILFKFEWDKILSLDMVLVVFTFLFIDLFDTVGTLIGASQPFQRKDGTVHNLNKAFMADAVGTTVGAMLGTSTVSTYVESVSGVKEGGRTGLTSFTTAVCMLLALFFAPFFLSVPAAATAPALVIVGLMMAGNLVKLPYDDYAEALPAFLCVIMMPLSFSISDGIGIGVLSFVLLNTLAGYTKKIKFMTVVLFVFFMLKYLL